MRHYIIVWLESAVLCCRNIIPEAVGRTITAAVANGMKHGTVFHEYCIPHTEELTTDYYCWSLD
jgi:hypothetical protein